MGVRFKPVLVDTNSPDEEGRLVFWQGRLVAVLVRLSECHGEQRDTWFLELSTGPCTTPRQPCFADLEEAAAWIEARVRELGWHRCRRRSPGLGRDIHALQMRS